MKKKEPKKTTKAKTNVKRIAVVALLAALTVAATITVWAKDLTAHPYAVTVDGKDVCYVEDGATAEKVMMGFVKDMIPENAELKLVSVDGDIAVSPDEGTELSGDDILTAEAAEEVLAGSLESVKKDKDSTVAKITAVSTGIEEKDFTPKIKYKKDDSMFAGQSEVVKEGKDGRKEQLISYTSINGEVVDKEVLEETILDEGESAVIKKGTLGLPEGEDWKTYEGDPVYKNGEEVVATGLKYLGAPYKYGGSSLVTGIDCVQFVRQMFKRFGISLPNGHHGLQHVGVGVSLGNAKKGDIVCYSRHVGIYVGDGKMVEAVRKGVRVGKINTKKVVAVRRVVQN